MRVRTESFAAEKWPGRPFTPAPAHMIPVAEANMLHTYWVTFDDAIEPRALGLLLNDVTDPNAVFVVVLVASDRTARRSLWEYRSRYGWRRLGGDGTLESERTTIG